MRIQKKFFLPIFISLSTIFSIILISASSIFYSKLYAQEINQNDAAAATSAPSSSKFIEGGKDERNAETENSPLYLGNPSRATKDTSQRENYLLEKNGYTLSYNNKTHTANWVAWHLDKSDLGDAGRNDSFRVDTQLPQEWYKVKSSDYQYSKYKFDRGHLCPSADRTSTPEINRETFLMTNMVPQSPNNNRVAWKDLESLERKLAQNGNELYIFAGPVGSGGVSESGTFTEIPCKENPDITINVPAYTWKILLVLPDGVNDISRIDSNTTVIAAMIPNTQDCIKKGSWEQHIVTVDDIENATGFDFFSELDDDTENAIESNSQFTMHN